jgi:hypothetical protein
MPRRLLVGLPIEVTEHHWGTETFGEPVDLMMEQPFELGSGLWAGHVLGLGRTSFVSPSTGDRRPGARSRTECDLMQPRAQRIPHPKSAGFPYQDEESGLEGILRIMRVGQHSATDAQHHRPVPLDKERERLFGGKIPIGGEPFQELAVRQLLRRTHVIKRSELPENSPIVSDRHD